MATIDIRDDEDKVIDSIIFASDDDGYAFRVGDRGGCLYVFGSTGAVAVRAGDISYLIKALQKAKEIWKD